MILFPCAHISFPPFLFDTKRYSILKHFLATKLFLLLTWLVDDLAAADNDENSQSTAIKI